MRIKKVWAVFFSPTGTTKKVTKALAQIIADNLRIERAEYDFTLPGARQGAMVFTQSDLVVFGAPVYAGRAPNLLLKYITAIQGNGALAVPLVLYGNRNYDDALIELRDILTECDCKTIAAAAFVGEHSFSRILAKGRPDEEDMAFIKTFAANVAERLLQTDNFTYTPVAVRGVAKPYRGYYQPRDQKGNPIDIRKVKPLTSDACVNCKMCANVCPMGAVNHTDVREVPGICVKCGACVKKCPVQAKYYDDQGYIYHKRELEEVYVRRALPESFF